MKILLVGSDQSMSLERVYAKYLRALGADVNHFTAPDKVFKWHSKNLFNKLLFRSGIYKGYAPVNRELAEIAHSYRPDVIWLFKGMEIFPKTLEVLRNDFKLVNYNPDHPFVITSRGSGNKNVTDSVGLYHLHFCYHSDLQQQIQNEYRIPAVFLPFGFEMTDADYAAVQEEQEINKLCFLGNPDDIRVETVLELANHGFSIDVYGHGWDKTPAASHKSIGVHDAVYGTGFWKKLRQYRVQVNIFRKHNAGSHNMRTFEVPAIGGVQLLPFSEEQAGFFEEGKEVFFYRDTKELLDKARHLLSLQSKEAADIRAAARKRSIESGYRYADRAATVYENCKLLLDGKLIVQQ